MLQALNAGKIISKDWLFKDVRPEDRRRYGERYILRMIDWELNGDPYFYEHRHTSPQSIPESRQDGGEEWWIYYNTSKFSGKKLVVKPGQVYTSMDNGVYNLLVLGGSGRYGGIRVAAGDHTSDELLVAHKRAIAPILVENVGTDDLVVVKFFGPDINPDVPTIPRYGA
jgi:hypothetical protein